MISIEVVKKDPLVLVNALLGTNRRILQCINIKERGCTD